MSDAFEVEPFNLAVMGLTRESTRIVCCKWVTRARRIRLPPHPSEPRVGFAVAAATLRNIWRADGTILTLTRAW